MCDEQLAYREEFADVAGMLAEQHAMVHEDALSSSNRAAERDAAYEVANTTLWTSIQRDMQNMCAREGWVNQRQERLRKAGKSLHPSSLSVCRQSCSHLSVCRQGCSLSWHAVLHRQSCSHLSVCRQGCSLSWHAAVKLMFLSSRKTRSQRAL